MTFIQLTHALPIEFGKEFISFVTGAQNEDRISLKYFHTPETGVVYALVRFGHLAQGPPGHAHGGAISAVFDEIMGACCWVNKFPAMTAQYTTRFLKPVPLETEVLFFAKIKKQEGSKIKLKAELLDENGLKYGEARGLFIMQDIDTLRKMSQRNPAYAPHVKNLENIQNSGKE